MTAATQKAAILRRARELGFDLAGVTTPLPQAVAEYHERLAQWVTAGQHAGMTFLARRAARPFDPATLLPGVCGVVALAVNYCPGDTPEPGPGPGGGRVARYALVADYHEVVGGMLEELERCVGKLGGQARGFVDSGPVPERAYAEAAGLGYIGRNAMLITRKYGSWVFLAVLLTTLELPPDAPDTTLTCGECRRCLAVCPTGAIAESGGLDARRCAGYLTVEHKGPIPAELAGKLGDRLFGCDTCQEVCPQNRAATPAQLLAFRELRVGQALPLDEVSALRDEAEFRARFAGTALLRAKLAGLRRNAAVVAANGSRAD